MKQKALSVKEIEKLREEELKELSMQRGGEHNNYTGNALAAQKILNERSGNFQNRSTGKNKELRYPWTVIK